METSSSGNAVVGGYYRDLGFNDDTIRFLTMAKPNQMLFLTEESADKFAIAHSGDLPSDSVIQLYLQGLNDDKSPDREQPQPKPQQDKPSDRVATVVTQNVMLRSGPSPDAANVLRGHAVDYIPRGTELSFPRDMTCSFNRRTQTTWCGVQISMDGRTYHGWVRAYYLQLANGTPYACTFKLIDHGCKEG
jgi:hypothetical protein